MPKLAANVSLLFTEHDFLDRFAAAAEAGFKGVEFLFPYDWPAADIAERLAEHGLRQVLFNLPPGDFEAGERGFGALPGREADFRAGLELALDYAEALKCPHLHVMAGKIPAGAEDADLAEMEATFVANLRKAAELGAKRGVRPLVEPLNVRDQPGYFLSRLDHARRLIEAVGSDNLGLQFDLYHTQIMEGDVARNISAYWDLVRHFQIAGVPERHEPDLGESNHRFLLDHIDGLGYEGWVGAEYRPRQGTLAGLGWARDYLG
ncbi:MAG: hydroxypyruvate isomerase family protein [Alphaproteobacteria bacterium]|nr:hydroxypyruvate isomerase family protein [Alphaproteobacteria bacterium]